MKNYLNVRQVIAIHLQNAVLGLFLVAWAGCTTPNPDYRPSACTAECTGSSAVCNGESGQCVQCTATEPGACVGGTPVCGPDNTCRGCTAHGECASNVCLPDGSCGEPDKIAYVDPMGTDTMSCTSDLKCPSLKEALSTKKPYIKMTGNTTANVTITDQKVVVLADPGAQVSGVVPGRPIITIDGKSEVSIYDLELTRPKEDNTISDGPSSTVIEMPTDNQATLVLSHVILAHGSHGLTAWGGTVKIEGSSFHDNGYAIYFVGAGSLEISESTFNNNFECLSIMEGCVATLRQSTLRMNSNGIYALRSNLSLLDTTVSNNTRKGVEVVSSIVNLQKSQFMDNGDYGINTRGGVINVSQSTISGNGLTGLEVRSLGTEDTKYRIVNNFITRNMDVGVLLERGQGGSSFLYNTVVDNRAQSGTGGGGVRCTGNVYAGYNIVVRNGGGDVSDPSSCIYLNSQIGGDFDSFKFVRPDTQPYDYHLTADTSRNIRDASDCSVDDNIGVDVDGQMRPKRGCDLGADEYVP